MAIKKVTDLASGVIAEYYSISEIIAVKLNVRIRVDLYLNKSSRDSGKAPIMQNCYQKRILTLPGGYSFVASSYDVNLFSEAYDYLKSLTMFDGATDV